MAYSYTEHVGTAGGTTGPFSYGPVSLLEANTEAIATQLKVYKNGTLLTFTTDYTIDTINKEVTTVANIFNTDILRIVRETKADARYVDYQDATNVTASLLDLDSNQLFYLVQEAYDLQTDAMTRGADGQWNARGYRIGNLSTAVNGTDAVNLNQLNAAVSGALPATLSGIGTIVYPGNGSTTDFALPAAISTITDPGDVEVYINGLRQRPTTHYTIVSGNVRITPAPLSTDNIMLAYSEGTVSALLTANSVQTLSIQDDAVTAAKILQGSNGQVLATVSGNSAWTALDSTYISNFDTQVRTNQLNQLAAATGNYSMGSNKITNLATPSSSSDAANKSYVDAVLFNNIGTMTVSIGGGGTTCTASISTQPFIIGAVTLNIPVTIPGPVQRELCCTFLFNSGSTYASTEIYTVGGTTRWTLDATRTTAYTISITGTVSSGTGVFIAGSSKFMTTKGVT